MKCDPWPTGSGTRQSDSSPSSEGHKLSRLKFMEERRKKKLVGAVTGDDGIFFGETSPAAAAVSTKSAQAGRQAGRQAPFHFGHRDSALLSSHSHSSHHFFTGLLLMTSALE